MENEEKEKAERMLISNEIWCLDSDGMGGAYHVVHLAKAGCSRWEIGWEGENKAYLHFGSYSGRDGDKPIDGDMIIHVDDAFLSKKEAEAEMAKRNSAFHKVETCLL
jgi:hypothetical protein